MAKYIEFASDDDLIKDAVGEVKNDKDLDMRFETPQPIKDGIYDRKIFGTTGHCTCRLITQGICPQCGERVYSEEEYKKNYAYYMLHVPFIIRLKLDSLIDKFSRLGMKLPNPKSTKGDSCRDNLAKIWSLEFVVEPADYDALETRVSNLADKMGGRRAPIEEYPLTGKNGKEYILNIYEVETYSDTNLVGPPGLLQLAWYSFNGKSLDFIKGHVNRVLPLMSPGLRPYSIRDIGGRPTKDIPEISLEYKMIIFADKYVKSVNESINTQNAIDRAATCYLLNCLYDQHIQNADMLQTSKQATFRKNVGTRVGSSMRGNAMSYLGALLGEIYLPKALAYHALQTQIIDKLCEDGPREGYDALKLYLKMDKRALDAFHWIVEHSQVLMNRNPSLHRNNILQFTPKLWPDDTPAIGVNPYVCFTGDTKVRMTNGDVYTFEELTKLYAERKTEELLVYSTNEDTGERVAAHFKNVGIRDYVHDLIDLEFPGGYHIRCTPEHPFRTKDGQWIEAKDITEDTELDEIDFHDINPLDRKTPHGTTICYIDGTYHSNNGMKSYLAQYGIDSVLNSRLKFNIGIHDKLPKCKKCGESCYIHKLHGLQEYCYEHYIENTKQSYCYYCDQKLPIKLHERHLLSVHQKTQSDNLAKRFGYESTQELPLCANCGKRRVKVDSNGINKYCSNRCQLQHARKKCNDPFGKSNIENQYRATKGRMKYQYKRATTSRLYFYVADLLDDYRDTHFKIGITSNPATRCNYRNNRKLCNLRIILDSEDLDFIIDLEEQVKIKFADRRLLNKAATEYVLRDKYAEVLKFVEEYNENHKQD